MIKNNRSLPFILLGILLAGNLTSASGETIDLEDGRVIEGKIVVVTKTIIGIETANGRVTVPRSRIATPDLAKWLQEARTAMGQENFTRAADLCEKILIWDPLYPGADIMQRRARTTLLEEQANTLSDANAEAYRAKLTQTVNKASQEEEKRLRIAHEKATAYQRMKDAKMKKTRTLFESGDRDGAATLCREILAQAPDGKDPQVTLLLNQLDGFKKRAEQQVLAEKARAKAAAERKRQAALAAAAKPTPAPAPTPTTTGSNPVDTTISDQVKDPATKAVVKEIEQKLAAINDYSCTIDMTALAEKDGKKTEFLDKQTRQFQRPESLNLQSVFSNVTPQSNTKTNSTMISILNATTYWQLSVETNKLTKYDVKRLIEAKCPPAEELQIGWLVQPFRWWCDPATLKLKNTTDTSWVIEATHTQPDSPDEKESILYTINRKTGILQTYQSANPAIKGTSTATFSDILVNPGIDPVTTFDWTPPAGMEYEDKTEDYIKNNAPKTP